MPQPAGSRMRCFGNARRWRITQPVRWLYIVDLCYALKTGNWSRVVEGVERMRRAQPEFPVSLIMATYAGGLNLARRSDACRYAAHLRAHLHRRVSGGRRCFTEPKPSPRSHPLRVATVPSGALPPSARRTCRAFDVRTVQSPPRQPFAAKICPSCALEADANVRFPTLLRSEWASPHAGGFLNSSDTDAARNVRRGRSAAGTQPR